MPPCQHNVLNDQVSPSINPATLPLPPSPCATPSAPVVRPEESAWRADPTVGPGELDGTARSTPKLGTPTAAPRESEASVEPTSVEPTAASVSEPVGCGTPSITFEDLARRYRQSHRKRIQRQRLESRLRTAKVSTGVLSRMIRVGNTVQRGLIETLKHEDKSNFVTLYQTLLDLQESCNFTARADEQADWSDDPTPSSDAGRHSSMDFLHQLSPQSRTDLLDILHRVRSDPQFLVNRLRSFTSAQLATFISPASSLDFGDPAFPSSFSAATSSSSRVRGQYSMNRILTTSASFKNHAYAFERTDPLTILFCNVFTAQLDSESAESRLRLDVWSTVCAQLISQGSSKFYPLVGQVLSSITHGIWKARPQFELYLMDILQTGAFLLEHTASPAGLDFTPEALDPLRTDVAEEFFASAVDGLFRVLDDPDCGFPSAVFQFAREVLGRLDSPDSRSRFLEYLFVQWFFPKFLYSALTYPEAHGLLLDFHIRKDAREKLLGQVGLRAYSQIYAVLRSMHHVSVLRPSIKAHVDNMLSRIYVNHSSQTLSAKGSCETESSADWAHRDDSTPNFLLLSSADVVTLLDALFPTPGSPIDPTPGFTGASMDKATNGLRSATSTGNTFAKTALGRIAHGNSSHMARSEYQISRAAARVRFELSDLDERHGRVTMDHPAEENWTILSVTSEDSALASTITPSYSRMSHDRDSAFGSHGQVEGEEALHNAVIRLINEDHYHQADELNQDALEPRIALATLRGRFNRAMFSAQNNSDFVNAHYWWNMTRQLRRQPLSDGSNSDAWILEPMHKRCMRSLEKSIDVIDRCEMELLLIDQSLHRLHAQVKSLMAVVTKIRIKMWYMTEVKNSMRYEEARHVTTALTMIPTARPQTTDLPEDSRSRFGTRSLGSSLFQKPEVQVLKMMTAPSSQGGPRKLSDEQVDLTRKWLAHSNIENFCKGEERIHRFCYEVRISVNRLVGETMAEAPILWASELFQRERVSYEGHAGRAFPGLSIPTTPRPSTGASDDHLHSHHLFGSNLSVSDAYNRPPDLSPLIGRKPSIQSFLSDSYRANRDLPSFEVSSMGGSPSRAASTTTTTSDNHSSFWSAHQDPSTYAASVSTAYSRPPSMISDGAMRQPRRAERKVQGKAEFIEDLRQHLTSLLLSDLGSPVWSCGSETDAWFARYLSHPPVKAQMQRQASFQKFYSDYEKRSTHFEKQRQSSGARRSRSLDRSWGFTRKGPSADVSGHMRGGSDKDGFPGFSYEDVFRRLLDTFSRHGNPLVKLSALRDLRSMVIASLVPVQENDSTIRRATKAGQGNGRGFKTFPRACAGRRSFTDLDIPSLYQADTTIPAMAPAASLPFGSTRSTHDVPEEEKIVATFRKLILDVKPKTLFRDLQYISAFVPTEYFTKSDRETAFLQFGLAALSLKEEVCHGMVEVADRIVSQELLRRHPLPGAGFHSRPVHAIDDAAEMWIITAKEGNPIAQRELAILYLTHPERLQRVTLPLTRPRDTFKAEMMYRRGKDSKSDPQSMCLALHWMQLSANGGDILARNRLREREEFDSIA
ncbi:Uncharacterized protein PECH_008598 [Penicillium ucsense]|uniref:Uncharacterized protein n=1 Tax=Penicillium ucsense TaxID=2839758 RepID=A0A8J8WMA8_9EURO|nr:Uncharacterized protein PECM_000103 [Penicillium ucsense]KAF7738606.1 Uncharacterized protein PECH_008598 [Penicillium ucsense]